MDEAKREEDRDQTSTERGSGWEEHCHAEEASRRAFIRKTAEAGALSLFGVMGLDALAEEVLARLNERTATRELAGVVGDLLHEAGIGAMAFAAEGCSCPEGMGGPNFVCAADHVPPFTCPQDFSCQPQHNFQCSPFHFECPTTGKTPTFNCSTTGQDPTFSCTDGYLCPGQGKFWASPCSETSPFTRPVCRSQQGNYHEECVVAPPFGCPPDGEQDPFTCEASALFACGNEYIANSQFNCGSGKFTCNGGTVYDFVCLANFTCMGDVHCQANHMFGCMGAATVDFNCETQGGFTCGSGGNLCNQPSVGDYGLRPPGGPGGDQRPGDFYCLGGAGTGHDFDCSQFSCAAVDDFICQGDPGGSNFQCKAVGAQFHCQPRAGGQFRCDTGYAGGFTCVPVGEQIFQCDPPTTFRPDYNHDPDQDPPPPPE